MTLKSELYVGCKLTFSHILHIHKHDQVYYSDSFIFGDMKIAVFFHETDLNSVKMQC